MARERVEDLGRLAVMIKDLLDHEAFGKAPWRPKDVCQWFEDQTEENRQATLRLWAYGFEAIKFKLYDLLSIAEGTDPLNESEPED